jgi:hypothetical protein
VPVIGKIPKITKKEIKEAEIGQMEMQIRGDTVGI